MEDQSWEGDQENTVNKSKVCHADVIQGLLHGQKPKIRILLLFQVQRVRLPHNGDSFINVNFPYKRGTSTVLSELFLCPTVYRNSHIKIVLMPKRHILEEHILVSSGRDWGLSGERQDKGARRRV